MRSLLWLLAGLLTLSAPALAETFVWIDDQGVTHFTDDPESIPAGAPRTPGEGRENLGELWDDVLAPADQIVVSRARGDERTLRLVRGAVEDLQRGENARAAAVLRGILADQPAHPEAHWYLALLDRQRGRYQSSEDHLRAFLAAAGDDLEPWRVVAERRLAALADERRLADMSVERGGNPWLELSSAHFEVHYDAELAAAAPDYAATVLGYLEDARGSAGTRLGALPDEAMGVLFYGKAAYLQAHRHRFSFQTVGFFDGRIHVVSAAHPAGELRALLFHEYAHAVFREQTGGDRPYWLNEGLAELTERSSRSHGGLTRSERVSLRMRIDQDRWISLRRLAPSFSGLDDADARAAYLESTAAAAWLSTRTTSAERARLLALLGSGASDDRAFRQVLGLDTAQIDAEVRAMVRAEFPAALH